MNLYGGTITGDLYGGGEGESTHAADVYGPVTVNVDGGNVNCCHLSVTIYVAIDATCKGGDSD